MSKITIIVNDISEVSFDKEKSSKYALEKRLSEEIAAKFSNTLQVDLYVSGYGNYAFDVQSEEQVKAAIENIKSLKRFEAHLKAESDASKEKISLENEAKLKALENTHDHWYTVKYPNAELEKDSHDYFGAPKAKYEELHLSRKEAIEVVKNKLDYFKSIAHKVKIENSNKFMLVDTAGNKLIECEDNCNITLYSDQYNDCHDRWNGNYCSLNIDGSHSGGWVSRHVANTIEWDCE